MAPLGSLCWEMGMNAFSHQCRNCHISCYEWAGSVWVALVTYIPSRLPKSHACCFLRDSVNGATILNSQLPKGFPSKINLAPMCFPLGRSCTTHRQTLLSVVFSCSLFLSAESEVHPEELWSICPNNVLLCISNVIILQIVLPCSFPAVSPSLLFMMETSTPCLFNGKLLQGYQMVLIQVDNRQDWTLAEVTETLLYHHKGKSLDVASCVLWSHHSFSPYTVSCFYDILELILSFMKARTMSDSSNIP